MPPGELSIFGGRFETQRPKRKTNRMHEEYQPGYNWEDLIEKEFKKSIPWDDFEEDSDDSEPIGDGKDSDL